MFTYILQWAENNRLNVIETGDEEPKAANG
jgi:hypothetical protein